MTISRVGIGDISSPELGASPRIGGISCSGIGGWSGLSENGPPQTHRAWHCWRRGLVGGSVSVGGR